IHALDRESSEKTRRPDSRGHNKDGQDDGPRENEGDRDPSVRRGDAEDGGSHEESGGGAQEDSQERNDPALRHDEPRRQLRTEPPRHEGDELVPPGGGRRENEEADPEDHQDRGKLALGRQVLERARPDGIREFNPQGFLRGADVRVLAEQGSEAGDYPCRVGARGQRDEKLGTSSESVNDSGG